MVKKRMGADVLERLAGCWRRIPGVIMYFRFVSAARSLRFLLFPVEQPVGLLRGVPSRAYARGTKRLDPYLPGPISLPGVARIK